MQIYFKFVSEGPINSKSALVQLMAWGFRKQYIEQANIDQDHFCYMVSLGHHELTTWLDLLLSHNVPLMRAMAQSGM